MHTTYLLNDRVGVRRAERLLQILALGQFALRDVDEHVRNLKHIVDVGLYSAAPFLHFVLVACDLEPLAALLEAYDGDVREPVGDKLSGVPKAKLDSERTDITLDLVGRLVDLHRGRVLN